MYRDGTEEKGQIRSIINQLNEDRPSKEKSREVVVREDGTKVVRVTKKRRVLVSESEKRRRSRRSFVMGIMVAFVALLGMAAFFGFRMSVMTGDAYLRDGVDELKAAWGATDIRVTGKGVDGRTFHLSSVIAEFPADSLIERVEFSQVEGELDSLSFFAGRLMGDQLNIARAEVQLRRDADKLAIRRHQGRELWAFRRVECAEFSVKMGENKQEAPVALTAAKAYLYHPRQNDHDSCVLSLEGGTLQLGDWKTIYLKEGKFHITPEAVEEFKLEGSTNRPTEGDETDRTSLTIFGRMHTGDSLAGPFGITADNLPLADLTEGRMEQFLTARTQGVPQNKAKSTVTLPLAQRMPEFNGEFSLKAICLSGLPAQTLLTEHITPLKRRLYLPPRISRGYAVLSHADGGVSVELPDGGAVERDLLIMKGKMTVNAANELSGTMSYAMPVLLTRVEYPDGISDPVFRENGENAWLNTTLSGQANMPMDNSGELDRNAEAARANRPERIPFNQIDLDRMVQESQKEAERTRKAFEDDGTTPSADGKSGEQQDDPFATQPKRSDDPFALPTPF